MSDTDDTDELLIIPPDFFLTNPVLEQYPDPYFNIVDTLIQQVSHLEDRVNSIQSSSELNSSFMSSPSDTMKNSPTRLRKFNSNEDLPHKTFPTSTQSTPQRPRNRFTVNSLPNSPDVDFKKPQQKSPRRMKKPDMSPMLGEIDSFISNVKLIKRLNAVRNLDSEFSSIEGSNNQLKSLELHQVDEMLKDMELQQKKNEIRLKEKEQEVFKDIEKPAVREKLWQAGDNMDSVPDYGLGMRKQMYFDAKIPVGEHFTKVDAHNMTLSTPDTSNEKFESDCSSESTQMTAFDKFKFDEDIRNKKHEDNDISSFNLGLVSLSKLWNCNNFKEIPLKFQQKLQEEKLRRQHCEQAILDLQNRILELQERVAVAIQVDEAKDKAILRFHDSWEKAGSKLRTLEIEKDKLEREIDKFKKKMIEEAQEAAQKIAHYEKEASKALNLAHSSQEKLINLEKLHNEVENDLRTALINSEEFQKKYLGELEKNKQYPEIIAQKELELNEIKNVLAEARTEVSESRKAVELCQSELFDMKSENSSLQSKLDKEKALVKELTDQKSKFLEDIEAHKNVASNLQEEVTKSRQQLENNKMELKNFYQGQVEIVVQNKLKEFQGQLDAAEKALKEELSKKEMSIAKMAASHIQQITEKHSLEIKLLEEKHQEECRLYQVQLSQMRMEMHESNQKLKRHNEKQAHIERQLHKFMESLKQDHVNSVDSMNSFRSKSFNNLEDFLGFHMKDEEKTKKHNEDEDKNSQLTYRVGDTPLSSRGDKGQRRKDNSIQDTIQMLLEKKPQEDGRHGDESSQVSRDAASMFYQRLTKDVKGKAPWK